MMALMNPRTSAATASVPYESTCTPGRILEQTNSASAVLIQCTRNRPMIPHPPCPRVDGPNSVSRPAGGRQPGPIPRQRPSVAAAVLHDGATPRADFLALAGLGRPAARWTGHRRRRGAARLRLRIHARPSAAEYKRGPWFAGGGAAGIRTES